MEGGRDGEWESGGRAGGKGREREEEGGVEREIET
jgi:hypothetical protein